MQRTVVVAVAPVRVVQVAGDKIVHVIAVRHRFMAAAGPVNVARLMPRAGMLRGADGGIGSAHFDDVLVVMVAVRRMQVAVVQIIDVAAVLDGGVAAAGSVDVVMFGMGVMRVSGHGRSVGHRPAPAKQVGVRRVLPPAGLAERTCRTF